MAQFTVNAQRFDAYKNFIRLHIDREGTLTAYALGVRSVPKHWIPNPDTHESAPFIIPRDSAALTVELIEPPIVIARAGAAVSGEV